MTLAVVRILFDFGLFILIWIIQLVVYPSFEYYKRAELIEWHNKYTQHISYIVFPLMLGQLLISATQLWNITSWYSLSSLLIIVILWLATFLQFVPLHNNISQGNLSETTIVTMVRKNWLRTILWTMLLVMSIVKMIIWKHQ